MDNNKRIEILNSLTSELKTITNDNIEGLFKQQLIEEFAEKLSVGMVLTQDEVTKYLTEVDVTNEIVMVVLDRYDTTAIISVFDEYLITLNGLEKTVRLSKMNMEIPFPTPIFTWKSELDTQAVIRTIKNKNKTRRKEDEISS